MYNKIIIGSRGSDLALWQANFIKKQLERKNKNLKVDIRVIKTKGDKILDVAVMTKDGKFKKVPEDELKKMLK